MPKDNGSYPLVRLQQRHERNRPHPRRLQCAREFSCRRDGSISLQYRYVGDFDDPSLQHSARRWRAFRIEWDWEGHSPHLLDPICVACGGACTPENLVTFANRDGCSTGVEQLGRTPDDGIEHWLHVSCRTADNVQHGAGRGLVFEGFLQFAFAYLLGLEQPRVLNRDGGLGGEVAEQLDLFIAEGPDLL